MAMIADAFVSRFTNLLAKLVEENVDLLIGVADEMEKLRLTLRTINEFLVDAERKRINNTSVDRWLKDLKDVMYDADDILDRCQVEAENGGIECFTTSWENCLCPRLSNSSPSTLWRQFLLPLFTCWQKTAVTHEIGSMIQELNGRLKRLEEVLLKKSQFTLMLNSLEAHQKFSQISRQTSPLVEPNITGSKIEEDTESLVNKLLTVQDITTNVLVFAITGLGGIGKTTLAQKIFNDHRIRDNFHIKMWVCVSQEFSEIKLLKEIITAAGGHVPSEAENRSQLEPLVMEQLRGKKFFLVLDDVWKIKVWNDLLRKPLQSGAAGSRILITTRMEGVAKQMKAVHSHHVEKLSPMDGWALLCKEVALSPSDIQNLKDIGVEIVSKCDGLPLAIKTIGGVLCLKNATRNAWEGVLHNTAWSITGLPEEIQAALYLSYEDLPTHLKQCFLYCSLFPEDEIINRFRLIRLWISEGFLKVQGSLSVEDVGEEYYTELIMRNLLLPEPEFYDHSGSKMHDLLRSLAQFLTRDESTTFTKIEDVNGSMGSMKLRRVSIVDKAMMEAPNDLTKQKYMRTLMLHDCPIGEVGNLVDNLSRLRVLSLRGTSITSLPDSLGSLVHLRYLDLAGSKIGVIPKTIGNLKNLLYLSFIGCKSLVTLPNSIVNLRSLMGLYTEGTMLAGLPSGIGRLQHLCDLQVTVPLANSVERFGTLEELEDLPQLRRLRLRNLERVSSSSEARGAALLDKPKLFLLELHCPSQYMEEEEEEEHTEEEMKKIKEVFEELRPPPCLELLVIKGYFGSEFPTWMTAGTSSSASNLSNLRRLDLVNCMNSERLPPLGLYSYLDHLYIRRAESVTSIGHEFLQGGSCNVRGACLFPKLEYLAFVVMPNWEEWVWGNGVQAMPRLKELRLHDCPKLRSLPEGLLRHATALTSLVIQDCSGLRAVENVLSLEKLVLQRNPNLATVSNLPSLRALVVQECPALQVVENLGGLQRMELRDYEMETLPKYLSEGALPATLKSLVIHRSESLPKNICQTEGSPEWPRSNSSRV